jgi:hypothetical protein
MKCGFILDIRSIMAYSVHKGKTSPYIDLSKVDPNVTERMELLEEKRIAKSRKDSVMRAERRLRGIMYDEVIQIKYPL